MRRYRIASWILFILSIIDFTLVAPVDVRDIHGVGVNVVDVAKYRIAALQKRMDPDEDHSSVTSEHGEPYHGGPGPELESDSDLDLDSELDSGSDSSSESDSDWDSELGSGSDSSSDSDDSDGGEAAEQWEAELQNYELFDIEEDQEEDLDSSDEEESDHEQSPPHSPEHDEDFPHSPESQHPAASTYEDLWRKLLKGSLRPRTSTFGAVDVPRRELQETDDTRACSSTTFSPSLQ